ncbi:hypothetical protein CAEBREN_04244 [Caenorhabditis brenneri]|uniref:Uncharacterized protein n=1 Tax=Caenorhabditis brenneri TaxID=135651 RepID=G0MXS6_CAEBE|nr:hypothetical protein CAEBREN_04244 [Caenorhabditis brenneri]
MLPLIPRTRKKPFRNFRAPLRRPTVFQCPEQTRKRRERGD